MKLKMQLMEAMENKKILLLTILSYLQKSPHMGKRYKKQHKPKNDRTTVSGLSLTN